MGRNDLYTHIKKNESKEIISYINDLEKFDTVFTQHFNRNNYLAWLASGDIALAVPWWLLFLVITIAGERLELTRFLPTPPIAQKLFIAIVGMLLLGAALGTDRLFAAGLVDGHDDRSGVGRPRRHYTVSPGQLAEVNSPDVYKLLAHVLAEAMASGDNSSEAFRSLPTRPVTCRSSPILAAGTQQMALAGKRPRARSRIWLLPFPPRL